MNADQERIAVIADIARHRRNRKGKSGRTRLPKSPKLPKVKIERQKPLPLIYADERWSEPAKNFYHRGHREHGGRSGDRT
jgi:hypothetical protein